MVSILAIVAIIVIAIIIGFVLFLASYRTVGAGEIGIVTEWGKPVYQVGEGLTTINPIWGDLIKMDIKTQLVPQKATAASSDLQNVVMELGVNYHLDASKTFELYREIGLDYKNRVIVPAVQEVVKQVTAQHTAQQVVTQREQIKTEIQKALDIRLAPRGIIIENVNILNVEFSAEYNSAIEATMTQKQNELKEKNVLNVVTIQSQQKVVQAQANYNATVTNAKAQSDSISLISKTLKENPEYLQYQAITKWNGLLPMLGGSDTLGGIIVDSNLVNKYMENVTAK